MRKFIVTQKELTKFLMAKDAKHWIFCQSILHLFAFKLIIAVLGTCGMQYIISDFLNSDFCMSTAFYSNSFITSAIIVILNLLIFTIILIFILLCFSYGTCGGTGFIYNRVKENDIVYVDKNRVIINEKKYKIKKQYISTSYWVYLLESGPIVFIPKIA